jgi:thiol-disulfide isomerase/thioredoxin
MTDHPTQKVTFRPSFVGIGLLVALVIAIGLSLAALYGTGEQSSNSGIIANAACPASSAISARLAPLAKGEVAAFGVQQSPRPLVPVSFNDGNGKALTIADFKGRTVLLNLWATWCAPCRHEMPALDKLQATLGGPDFEVVSVNIDQRNLERPRKWLAEANITKLAFYADPSVKIFQDLKAAGRAVGMPTTILIDKDGCDLGAVNGPAEWASEDALALIKAAMAR